jgi:glycerol-3-phosphate O-acyltransferase / dihydroxyacetone phosphate acyltransferase
MPATASPLVRWLARVISRLFYRIDLAGYVPVSGAVLLLANHPNALLDPAIVWATSGRDVRFLAKSTLFEGAFAPVLKGAGAIPVYRRLDQGVDPSRNAETFEAVDRALADGHAVCVFPEGMSHSAGKLAPLRTGAARMALGAERQGIPVRLVAVGLNFDRKTAFRSRVTILYGQPFSVRDLVTETADEQITVRLVTERIAMQMRRLVVEADPETDAALVARVERLYAAARGRAASPEERVARRQAIAIGIDRLRRADQPRFLEIARRLRRYDQRLRRFQLRDRHLDWDVSMRAAVQFVVREAAAGIVLIPLAAAGFAIFWVPYQLTGLLARRATSERDVAATAKVFVGTAVYGVWLVLIVVLIWFLTGGRMAAFAAVLLPMLAIAGLFAVERETSMIDTARAWLVLRRAKTQSRARLKQERSELAGVLEEVYEWLSAERPGPAAAQKPN